MKIVEAVRLLGADAPHDVLWEASVACVYEYLRVLGKVLVREGNLCSQDLDDAVADAYMDCSGGAPRFRGRSDPEAKAWLMTIIRNSSKDLYIAKNRSQRIERQSLHIDVYEWEEGYASAETVGGVSEVRDYVLRTELREPGKTEGARLKKRRQRSKARAKRLSRPLLAQVRASFRVPTSEEFCATLERAVSSVAELNQIGFPKNVYWLLLRLQPRKLL